MPKHSGGVLREVLRERERRVWELRQRCWTHDRIAAEVGIDRTTVSKMLKRLNERTLAKITDEMAAEKMAQLQQLAFIADEAIQAWEKSKTPLKELTKRNGRKNVFGKTDDGEITITTRERVGDSRYLDSAMKALADIRAIMRLNAPIDIAGPVVVKVVYPEDKENVA